jgi:hypothetical protein
MGGGILEAFYLIMRACDYPPFVDNNSPHRDFVFCEGQLRFFKGLGHVNIVGWASFHKNINTTLLNFNFFSKLFFRKFAFYITYDISMRCSKILLDSSS